MRHLDVIWRGAVIAAALVAALLDAPQALVSLLVAVGLLAVALQLGRLRGRGALDTLLVAAGGILVTLVLAGLVLGSTALGLHPRTWSIALALVSLLGLAVAGRRPRPARPTVTLALAAPALRALPWVAASVVVVVVAVTMSLDASGPPEAPPVQMSFGSINGTSVQVVVTSATGTVPLEMRTASNGSEISYPLFAVDGGGSRTTTLSLPASGRTVITLNYPDQSQPLRSLTLDR